MFKEETGVSIYAFIKRMKMDQSAVSLKVEKDKTITDIGIDYGFLLVDQKIKLVFKWVAEVNLSVS